MFTTPNRRILRSSTQYRTTHSIANTPRGSLQKPRRHSLAASTKHDADEANRVAESYVANASSPLADGKENDIYPTSPWYGQLDRDDTSSDGDQSEDEISRFTDASTDSFLQFNNEEDSDNEESEFKSDGECGGASCVQVADASTQMGRSFIGSFQSYPQEVAVKKEDSNEGDEEPPFEESCANDHEERNANDDATSVVSTRNADHAFDEHAFLAVSNENKENPLPENAQAKWDDTRDDEGLLGSLETAEASNIPTCASRLSMSESNQAEANAEGGADEEKGEATISLQKCVQDRGDNESEFQDGESVGGAARVLVSEASTQVGPSLISKVPSYRQELLVKKEESAGGESELPGGESVGDAFLQMGSLRQKRTGGVSVQMEDSNECDEDPPFEESDVNCQEEDNGDHDETAVASTQNAEHSFDEYALSSASKENKQVVQANQADTRADEGLFGSVSSPSQSESRRADAKVEGAGVGYEKDESMNSLQKFQRKIDGSCLGIGEEINSDSASVPPPQSDEDESAEDSVLTWETDHNGDIWIAPLDVSNHSSMTGTSGPMKFSDDDEVSSVESYNDNKKVEEEVSSLKSEQDELVEKMKSENAALVGKLAAAQEERNALSRTVAELNGSVNTLFTENDRLMKELSTSQGENDVLNSRLNEREAQAKSLKDDHSGLKEKLDTTQEERASLEGLVAELYESVGSLSSENNLLMEKLNTRQGENDALISRLNECKMQKKYLEEECAALKDEKTAIEDEKAALAEELDTIQEERGGLCRKAEELDGIVNTLSREKAQLEEQCNILNNILTKCNDQTNALKEKPIQNLEVVNDGDSDDGVGEDDSLSYDYNSEASDWVGLIAERDNLAKELHRATRSLGHANSEIKKLKDLNSFLGASNGGVKIDTFFAMLELTNEKDELDEKLQIFVKENSELIEENKLLRGLNSQEKVEADEMDNETLQQHITSLEGELKKSKIIQKMPHRRK